MAAECAETPVLVGPVLPGAAEHEWVEHYAASSSGAGWVVWRCAGCGAVSHAAPFAVRAAAAREDGTDQVSVCGRG